MFVLDNNFLLDIVTKRTSKSVQYTKILAHLLKIGQCAISTSSLHNLEYVVRRHYLSGAGALRKILSASRIVKTPSYVDFNHPLAKSDLEDYLIELSAHSNRCRHLQHLPGKTGNRHSAGGPGRKACAQSHYPGGSVRPSLRL